MSELLNDVRLWFASKICPIEADVRTYKGWIDDAECYSETLEMDCEIAAEDAYDRTGDE